MRQNRTGNFSDWLAYNKTYQIYDPLSGDPATGVGRTPFPNNMIPTIAAQLPGEEHHGLSSRCLISSKSRLRRL